VSCVKLSPPQFNESADVCGKGAYCFVIDISGSMNAAAKITNDDGDNVNHGWSQLDIAKHSTNTFVASLEDNDYISIVTYSDAANVLLDWTLCDGAGRERAIAAIHSMRPERSTNLMAGVTTGFQQFEKFPVENSALNQYTLGLIITTDGMPSSQWHPARGRDGYAPLVNILTKGLIAKRQTAAARPVITSIGIGFQLDSELLSKMSQTFLHMPDPGQIGPFIVNLLAACRSTARFGERAVAANACHLLITPASAVAAEVPGYEKTALVNTTTTPDGATALKIDLGSVLYDQIRHVLLTRNSDFDVTFVVGDEVQLVAKSTDAVDAGAGDQIKYHKMRLAMAGALDESVANKNAGPDAITAAVVSLQSMLQSMGAHEPAGDPLLHKLYNTLDKECVLGAQSEHFGRWGEHYFRTLPNMLRNERRSNFRDECLQDFGKKPNGDDGIFEAQSGMAEMRFATLTPPEPSLLRPQAPVPPPAAGGGMAMQPAVAAPPPRVTALPDEFMRGGGCFGPDATVVVARADGSMARAKVSQVAAGDQLLGEDGRLATVRCVVLTECAGGRAQLTRLPNGVELTEWHPVRDPSGRWRFPLMLGTRIIRQAAYVYNFVLAPGHPTVLVGGVPCAALGHGLKDDVVAHPYWGTQAVLDDLRSKPGWTAGRIVLPAATA